MLLPGVRLVARPGALHFFDGRRVVSLAGDDAARAAVRAVLEPDATGGRAAGTAPHGAAGDGAAGDGAAVDGAAVDGAAVADARALLERLALVGEPPETPLSTGAAYACAAVGGWVGPAEAAHRLAATTVHVWAEDAGEGDGPDDAGPGGLARTLRRSGLSVALLSGPAAVADLDPARSVVVVAADEAEPLRRMRAANRACLAAGVPWLPIGAYDGARLPVGPLCLPGQTACFGCLEQRLAANVAYAGLFPAVAAAPAAPTPPALRDWAHALAGLVLLHWIGLREATLPGRLFTLVPAEIAVRSAPVLRVPRCPVCTAPEYRPAAAPWGPDRDH